MRFLAAALLCVFAFPLSALPADKPETLKPALQAFVDSGTLSGVVTFVGNKDGVLDVQVLGLANVEEKLPMKRDTIFRIASMTKPITVLALLQLAEEGKLSVEDPVEKYLPEFKGQMLIAAKDQDTVTLKKPARPIAIKDLLTHTSGLAQFPAGMADIYAKRNYTLSETTIAISQLPLQFEPGTKWSYNNPGIDAVGRIIEVVSGMSYDEYMAARIFQPLGMVDTTAAPKSEQLKRVAVTYDKQDGRLIPTAGILDYTLASKHPVPAGGLYSTGDDLAKLYQCLLNKGTLNGKRIIGEKTLADMVSIHTGDEKSGYTDNMTWGFGFSIIRESKGVAEKLSPGSFGHGGAYGTQGWIDPTKGLYTILLIQRVNLTEGDAIRKTLHDASVSLLATSRPSIEARFLAGPAKLPQRPTRQLVEFR